MTPGRDNSTRRASSAFGSRLLGPEGQSPRSLRVRVQVLLTVLLVSTNLVGALLVFVIASFVVPQPHPSRAMLVSLAIAIPVYVTTAVVIGVIVGTALGLHSLRWAVSGQAPTPADRRRALGVPLAITQLQGSLWLIATVLFTVLSVVVQPERALTTGITVGVAGFITGALAYLFAQFALRPVAARALANAPVGEHQRGVGVGFRMLIFWCVGTALPVVALVVTAILVLAGAETSRTRLAVICLVVGGAVLVFGFLVTLLNARSVVAPVRSVRDAMVEVAQGNLERSVPVYDGTELGSLQAGFNQMAAGLREREHLRDLFGRHVGREVAAAAAQGDVELGGEARVASVLFVDLTGSTTYATRHSPEKVVEMLNRFFAVVVDEVDAQNGLVNKFIGDAVLAVFGAPVEQPEHASAALAAARTMARRLAAEVPEVGAGIGVATGEVVAGNVGHHDRFEYTVIGDAVNSAARLTDLAKEQPGGVLVAQASVVAASEAEAAHWTSSTPVVLRGRDQATATAVPKRSQ